MRSQFYWTNEMTNAALEHLENNKGTNGRYMKEKIVALEEGVKFIAERCPSRKVTTTQLLGKFEKLWSRHRRPDVPRNSSLFSEGCSALDSAYDQGSLLNQSSKHTSDSTTGLALGASLHSNPCPSIQQSGSHRTKISKTRRRPHTVGRKRPLRASPNSRINLAYADENRERATTSGMLHTSKRSYTVQTNPIVLVQVHSPDFQNRHVSPTSSSALSLQTSHLSYPRYEPSKEDCSKDQSHTAIAKASCKPEEVFLTPYVSFHGGAHEKRQPTVNDYLLENPEKYSPSSSLLQNLKETAMKEMQLAIRDLLEATKTEHDKVPQIYSSLSSTQFFDICKRIYGMGHKDDLRRMSETLLSHSPIGMRNFLRTMVAASVNEWVFDGRHDSLPQDIDSKTGVSAIYESELAMVYPELHEQILRKSKSMFINEKLDLKPFVAELSDRLSGALRPFLVTNLTTITSESFRTWHNDLDNIFHAALRLKAQAMLKNQQLFFLWPRAGECFNHKTMRTEDEIDADSLRKVHVALFPALIERLGMGTIEDRSKERIVFPAVVILQ